jgi:hypothetical protein
VTQHDQGFVIAGGFLADQSVVFLVERVAVVSDVVDGVVLLAVVEVGSDVVGQLALVLLLVLVSHLP